MKDFLNHLIYIINRNKDVANRVEGTTKLVLTGIEFNGIDFGEMLEKMK